MTGSSPQVLAWLLACTLMGAAGITALGMAIALTVRANRAHDHVTVLRTDVDALLDQTHWHAELDDDLQPAPEPEPATAPQPVVRPRPAPPPATNPTTPIADAIDRGVQRIDVEAELARFNIPGRTRR